MTAVEVDGTRVRARLVGFGESIVGERTEHGIVAIREQWGPGSVTLPTERIRMLWHHDRRTPVGWWETFTESDNGVYGEGRLVGSRGTLDQLRELVRDDLMSGVSIGFVPSPDDIWSRPEQRGGLPTVTRRGVGLREASIVDEPAVTGSQILSIAGQRAGPSSSTIAAIAEAESAVRGSGYAARERIDRQADVALLLREADQLVAAGQRWATPLDTSQPTEPTRPAPAPVPMSWQQRLDIESDRIMQRMTEDAARADYAEAIERQRLAERSAQHQAELRAAILRAH